MSGHTPGPWFWAVNKWNSPTSLRQSGSGDVVASAQADVGDYGLSVDAYMDVSEDDARLIAAAPELLAALTDMREGWRYIHQHHGDLYGVGWDRAEKAADAAIAKATGAGE